jgi:hypothetical protein
MAQRVVAFTFLGAFGLTILTVIMTGLWVRSSAPRGPTAAPVELVIGEPHTINLLFESRSAVDDVELIVELPKGLELADGSDGRRVEGQTRLVAGNNLLPLKVVARSGPGGQLAARLRHGREQKTFAVDVVVRPR